MKSNSNQQHLESRKGLILSLGFRPSGWESLCHFVEHLWSSNSELNLFSRKMSFEELIDNHIIDCLLPLKHWPPTTTQVADFGTGGGLPALLYAIQFPDCQFDLYEKSPKKQAFLKGCQKITPNIQVVGEIPKLLPQYDLITARAFKPIDVILQLSRDHYKSHKSYFLLKARREKIEDEIQEAEKHMGSIPHRLIPLNSPLLEVERHLVLIP